MATSHSFFVLAGVSLVSFVLGFVVGKGKNKDEPAVVTTTSWREDEDRSEDDSLSSR